MSDFCDNMYCSFESTSGTLQVKWNFENFHSILDNPNIRELRSDQCKDKNYDVSIPTKFVFKAKLRDTRNSLMQIYFLSSLPVCVKILHSGVLNHIWTANRRIQYDSVWRSGQIDEFFLNMQPNKYYFVTIMPNNLYDDKGNYLHKGQTLELNLEFTIKLLAILPNSHLCCDLRNLLQNSMHSDITIKSSEGTEFYVHKLLLMARSEVLKAHFEHNTQETVTNIIECPFDTEVLQELLTYIYTDIAPKGDEIPEKLLLAADFYQLHELKSECEEVLSKKLTVDNALDTLQLADLHSATNLKKKTLNFFNSNRAKLIIKTESWERMKSVDLIKTMFECTLNNKEE